MKNKNFLIRDGFRERVIRLWAMPKVKFGLSLLMFAIAFYCQHLFGAEVGLGSGVLATAPLIAFKKDGLDGDNLKLVDDLEKRMSLVPDELRKQILDGLMKEEFEKRMKKFEGLDPEKIISMLGDDEKGLRSILLKQGEEITKLKGQGGKQEDLSIRGQISAWHEKNKEVISAIRSGQKRDLPPLEIRVASPMTPSNSLNSSAYLPKPEYQAGANEVVRLKPTFWSSLKKGKTGSAAYVWVNKTNPLGAAAFIGPGVAKPGISFELNTEISNAKKIAASEKIAIELLDDIDGMTSYVEQELVYKVDAKTNTTLMTGTLSSTVPAGIQTISVPFSQTGLATTNPNNYDAIRAIVAQLAAGNFDGSYGMVTVYINPVDAANMDMAKAISQGTYLLPPFSTADGRQVAGALVIEDNNVPAGSIQAGLMDLFKVLIYKDFSIAYGWENDDFTKNLVTIIGERRIHSFHSANHAGAFVFDTFSNIKTLITG